MRHFLLKIKALFKRLGSTILFFTKYLLSNAAPLYKFLIKVAAARSAVFSTILLYSVTPGSTTYIQTADWGHIYLLYITELPPMLTDLLMTTANQMREPTAVHKKW